MERKSQPFPRPSVKSALTTRFLLLRSTTCVVSNAIVVGGICQCPDGTSLDGGNNSCSPCASGKLTLTLRFLIIYDPAEMVYQERTGLAAPATRAVQVSNLSIPKCLRNLFSTRFFMIDLTSPSGATSADQWSALPTIFLGLN